MPEETQNNYGHKMTIERHKATTNRHKMTEETQNDCKET